MALDLERKIVPEEASRILQEIIKKYGLPQEWNNHGKYGPERYIEAHIWSDDIISEYLV